MIQSNHLFNTCIVLSVWVCPHPQQLPHQGYIAFDGGAMQGSLAPVVPLAYFLELPVLLGRPLPSPTVGRGGIEGSQGGSRGRHQVGAAVYKYEYCLKLIK